MCISYIGLEVTTMYRSRLLLELPPDNVNGVKIEEVKFFQVSY